MTPHALGDGLGQRLDLVWLVRDQQRHVDRPPEALGIAPDGGAVLVEDGALAGHDLGAAPDVPVIGVLGHDAQGHALAAAADHQLGMRLLHGLGIEGRVRELVVLAVEGAAPLRPQRVEYFARLVQPLEPLAQRVEGDAVGFVLVLLPARAEAEDEPTARDDVDLGRHLGDHGGMPVGVAEHDRPHAHARDQRGQGTQRAPRLEHRALALLRVRDEVVGHAGDVPSRGLEVLPEVQHARPGLPTRAREDAESHVPLLLAVCCPPEGK